MAASYARFRWAESRGDPITTSSEESLLHLAISVIGNALIAMVITAGPTLNSVDEQWNCHGAPYYMLLAVVALGGALGGLVLYYWETYLASKPS